MGMTGHHNLVCIEIGDGVQDEGWLRDMARAPAEAHASLPRATIVLLLSGYDDDQRSIWEIPEAADYVRRFAKLSGLNDWRTSVFGQLSEETKFLLIMCDALDKPHPFTAVIE